MKNLGATEKAVGHDIFGDNVVYVIPPYQREYTWKLDHWRDLYADLSAADDHFFGMFVFIEREEKKSGPNFPLIDVVDGQQRLATLSLLFLALYKYLRLNLQPTEDTEFKQWFDSVPPEDRLKADFSAILMKKIAEKDERMNTRNNTFSELEMKIFKYIFVNGEKNPNNLHIQLAKCNNNDEDYQAICNEAIPDLFPTAKLDKRKLLYRAYKFFLNRFEKEEFTIDSINTLIDTLDKKWLAIEMRPSSEMDACLLFDCLNNRGEPLSPIDIIKNKLFAAILNEKNNTQLEECDAKWKDMIENLSTSDLTRFFASYYNAFVHPKGQEKRHPISDKQLITEYSKLMEDGAIKLFDDLRVKAEYFKKIILPENIERGHHLTYKWSLCELTTISALPSYSLLLYIFNRWNLASDADLKPKREEYKSLIDFLAKYFARRHLSDMPPAKILSGIFVDLITKYEQADTMPEKAQEIFCDLLDLTVKARDGRISPKDDILAAIKVLTYESQQDKNLIRYLFTLLEVNSSEFLQSKKAAEKFWDSKYENDKKVYDYDLEHIFPRGGTLEKEWRYMLLTEKDNREDFVNSIGNLTLLKKDTNRAVAQNPFITSQDDKRKGKKEVLKEEAFAINAYVTADERTRWTEEEIRLRTEELAEKMAELLRFPPGSWGY